MDEYVSCLLTLASACFFDTLQDGVVRDQFFEGTSVPGLRICLRIERSSLTFIKVTTQGRCLEQDLKETKEFEVTSVSVHKTDSQSHLKRRLHKPRPKNDQCTEPSQS